MPWLTQLEKALKAAGNVKSEFVVYPDTPHAFHADYRPSYRKAAADDIWASIDIGSNSILLLMGRI